MADTKSFTLKIDEEFKHLIPPLSPEERNLLEANIIKDGCREPICVWNESILDGHNRYEICTQLQIPFKISYILLRSREEAVAWICTNQLGRRNITDEARRYLIGKRYIIEKIIGAHNAAGTNQYTRKEVRPKMYAEPLFDETACRTRERLGKEYLISPTTIEKYSSYTQSLDTLSKIQPDLLPKILSGQIKISQGNVIGLSKLSPTDIHRVSADLLEDKITYSTTRAIVPKKKDSNPGFSSAPIGSVKDMPAYDPDAEILSLVFTIPSWVSSIDRTRSAANLINVSGNARQKLEEELIGLRSVVDIMLLAIRRRTDGRF